MIILLNRKWHTSSSNVLLFTSSYRVLVGLSSSLILYFKNSNSFPSLTLRYKNCAKIEIHVTTKTNTSLMKLDIICDVQIFTGTHLVVCSPSDGILGIYPQQSIRTPQEQPLSIQLKRHHLNKAQVRAGLGSWQRDSINCVSTPYLWQSSTWHFSYSNSEGISWH